MKKILKTFALVLALVMCCSVVFAACGGNNDDNTKKPYIQLRSDAKQELEVGKEMKIVYSLENLKLAQGETKEDKVKITSSNPQVASVDDWANVTALSVGKATITIALVDDPDTKVEVEFNCTKTFFMQDKNLRDGTIEFDEANGVVDVKDGQAKVLVNELGQNWYFKTKINHLGHTGSDSIGTWGVGSFLTSTAIPIGDSHMFWLMLGSSERVDTSVRVRYGGWRYNGINYQQDTPIDNDLHDCFDGVYLTIARLGSRHYVIADFGGGDVVKKMVDIPNYEGVDTYPAIFGQNQILRATEYESCSGEIAVMEKLAGFQDATGVDVNVVDNRLEAGTYNLSATVTPFDTVDKRTTWSLKEAVNGVSISEQGVLTIANDATGSFTVVAKTTNNIADEQSFTIVGASSATGTILTDRVVSTVSNALTLSENGFVVSEGNAYVPLNAKGDKWYATMSVAISGKGAVGIMGNAGGYFEYATAETNVNTDGTNNLVYGDNDSLLQTAFAPDGSVTSYSMGVARDGAKYYVFINGRLLKSFTSACGDTSPVIYTKGANATITNVTVTTDATAIATAIDQEYYVGGFVTAVGNVYNLVGHHFGDVQEINWPPVNDYQSGLKYTQTLTGNYTIEFTMSNFKPLTVNGAYDGKVLVYLRSERTTSSLQFVFKGNSPSNMTMKACFNWDDASWTEYAIPSNVSYDLNGAIKVKVVKTMAGVDLYLNDTLAFSHETDTALMNAGHWNAQTQCTPGIGSFLMGVTISNPTITDNN